VIEPLSRARAALLVIDIQDRLASAMPADVRERVVANARVLIAAARQLALPIVVTRQYPKGLGDVLSAVDEVLAGAADVHRFDKVEFSAEGCSAFAALAPRLARDQWIVCGMETHVCVYQTARGLVGRGHAVHACIDASCSRTKASWRVGVSLLERTGAIATSTEACVFDLLGCAGTDEFRALSKLVK
jgi:nicotinamidase-related amidase